MSGHCVERVLDSGLDDRLKKTAVALATYAADDGSRVWPSMPELARRSGQNVRTVKRHMKELRTMEVVMVTLPATQHHPAHYRLLLENLPVRTPAGSHPEEPLLVGLDTIPGVTAVSLLKSRGDILSARGDRAVSPDPSLGSATRTRRTAASPQRDSSGPGVTPLSPLAPDVERDPTADPDYVAVVTAVVTKDILPRRLPDDALLAATRDRCEQLQIPCSEDVVRKAVDSALFRYYRALRLVSDLPPDPRGIYHDHVQPRAQGLPMPMGVRRAQK